MTVGRVFAVIAILSTLVVASSQTSAQKVTAEWLSSTPFLRDVCVGRVKGLTEKEQEMTCTWYLSGFLDAIYEYRKITPTLLCLPSTFSVDVMRQVFLSYAFKKPPSPWRSLASRDLMHALIETYPCAKKKQ